MNNFLVVTGSIILFVLISVLAAYLCFNYQTLLFADYPTLELPDFLKTYFITALEVLVGGGIFLPLFLPMFRVTETAGRFMIVAMVWLIGYAIYIIAEHHPKNFMAVAAAVVSILACSMLWSEWLMFFIKEDDKKAIKRRK